MSYDIIVTPEAIAAAGQSHREPSSLNDDFVEILFRFWEDAMKAANSPAPFDASDEAEAKRGLNYAFDDTLVAKVNAGEVLTIQTLVEHLKTLNCPNPHEVISLFLQTRAEFYYHIGNSVFNYFLRMLGEEAIPPFLGDSSDPHGLLGAQSAEFKINVVQDPDTLLYSTTLSYDKPFSLKKITKSGIELVEAGTLHAAITITADNQLVFDSVKLTLDETKPEVQEIIDAVQRNAPVGEANEQSMTINADAIQSRQAAVPLTHDIIISQDAFERSAEIYKNAKAAEVSVPVHSRFVDMLGENWQKLLDVSSAEEIIFNAEDEEEIGRGVTYAFDDTLAAQVTEDNKNKLTIDIVRNHLIALGSPNPDTVIASLLQHRGGFAFRFGATAANRVIMDLGEGNPVAFKKGEDGSLYTINVTADGTTQIIYEDDFSMKGLDADHNTIVVDNIGHVRSVLEISADNQLTLQPIVIQLDKSKPEIDDLINKTQLHITERENENKLQINASAVDAFEDGAKHTAAVEAARKRKMAEVQPKNARKPTTAAQNKNKTGAAKAVLGGMFTGLALGLVYLGLAAVVATVITTAALTTAGIAAVVVVAAAIGMLATYVGVKSFTSSVAPPEPKVAPAVIKSSTQNVSAMLGASHQSSKRAVQSPAPKDKKLETAAKKRVKIDKPSSESEFFGKGVNPAAPQVGQQPKSTSHFNPHNGG